MTMSDEEFAGDENTTADPRVVLESDSQNATIKQQVKKALIYERKCAKFYFFGEM